MINKLKSFYGASIKRQLILGIALVHAVMMTIFIVDLVNSERAFLIEQHKKKAQSLSKTLASTSTSWVLSNDFIGLSEVIESMHNYPDINYIMILNNQGQVLGHTKKEYVGKYLSDKLSQTFLKGTAFTNVVYENDHYIDVVSPILRENQHIGWARLALSKDEINSGLHKVSTNGIFYTLIAIFVGVIFAFFMAKGLTKGIYTLLKTINRVKEGNFSCRSNIDRSDEIGLLSLEFDTMIQELSKQKTFLNDIINSSSDLIFYKDYYNFDGMYIGCNDAFSKFVGKSKEQIIGKTDLEVFDKKLGTFFRMKDKEMLENKKPINNEEWVKYPDGRKVLLDTLKTPLYNFDHSILGVLGISRDITDKFYAQQELDAKNQKIFEQAKLASMGEMIGNIAHQWRQPLSVISTGATGLKLNKELGILTDEFFSKTCDIMNENAQYLSKTIDDFRNFLKDDKEIIEFELSSIIESFLHLVEGSVKNNNITIVKEIPKDILLYGYPNELMQCFINIFNNSKDALKAQDSQRYFFILVEQKVDDVIIVFRDNAGGIPTSVLPHVFEPYFTTKHQSQGTGLGLSMVFNLIVKGMKGNIEANTQKYMYEGQEYLGAEFKITLPLVIKS